MNKSKKYSNKFLQSFHNLANQFVHSMAEESNKETIKRGKTKILPKDIFECMGKFNFNEKEISEIREKLDFFEKNEVKKKCTKKKLTEEETLKLALEQNNMLEKLAKDLKDKNNMNIVNEGRIKEIEIEEDNDDFGEF